MAPKRRVQKKPAMKRPAVSVKRHARRPRRSGMKYKTQPATCQRCGKDCPACKALDEVVASAESAASGSDAPLSAKRVCATVVIKVE